MPSGSSTTKPLRPFPDRTLSSSLSFPRTNLPPQNSNHPLHHEHLSRELRNVPFSHREACGVVSRNDHSVSALSLFFETIRISTMNVFRMIIAKTEESHGLRVNYVLCFSTFIFNNKLKSFASTGNNVIKCSTPILKSLTFSRHCRCVLQQLARRFHDRSSQDLPNSNELSVQMAFGFSDGSRNFVNSFPSPDNEQNPTTGHATAFDVEAGPLEHC